MREHYYSNGKFYCINGEPYIMTFPISWSTDHIKATGPESCANCAAYGTWNGVFVCYCSNCAKLYDGKRGYGVQNYLHINDEYSKLVTMNSYLEGIKLGDIGDKDIFDSEKSLKFPIYGEK